MKKYKDWCKVLFPSEIEALEEMLYKGRYLDKIEKNTELSNNEVFRAILEYEGLISYDNWIKSIVCRVYEIKLNN